MFTCLIFNEHHNRSKILNDWDVTFNLIPPPSSATKEVRIVDDRRALQDYWKRGINRESFVFAAQCSVPKNGRLLLADRLIHRKEVRFLIIDL